MSVVTRQTLILKTCDKARQEPESNKFFGENGAVISDFEIVDNAVVWAA